MIDQRTSIGTPATPSPLAVRGLVAAALTTLVLVVFLPCLEFEFIKLDVPDQILDNRHIRGLTGENIGHILTSRCVTSYYPVRTLTFAFDYEFAGLDPKGFKRTNLLIHLTNTLLVFWLVLRVTRYGNGPSDDAKRERWNVVAAGAAAGVFAAHPLVVETVVWTPGREELLMTLGTLACLHCHLTSRRLQDHQGSIGAILAWQAAAATLCLAACLSNAVGAVIPLLITAWDALTIEDRKLAKIARGTAVLWLIAVGTIAIKRIGYAAHPAFAEAAALEATLESLGYDAGRSLTQVDFLSLQHVGLVFRVFWLNLTSVVCPTNLTLSYDPVAPQSVFHPQSLLGAGAACVGAVLLWLVRRRTVVCFAILWFLVALAPVGQLIPHHIHRADRFLYLPLVGVAILLAPMLAALGAGASRSLMCKAVTVVVGLFGLVMVGATVDQTQTWRNNLTVWGNCVQTAPNNYVAHRLLGSELAELGQFEEAFAQYQAALAINVHNVETLNLYSRILSVAPVPHRDCQLAVRLAERAMQLTGGDDAQVARSLAMAHNGLAEQYRRQADFAMAIEHYAEAARIDPAYVTTLFNQALLLATCSDDGLRDPGEAVRLAEQAYKQLDQAESQHLLILATVYERAGQPEMARRASKKAAQLAKSEVLPPLDRSGDNDLHSLPRRAFSGR